MLPTHYSRSRLRNHAGMSCQQVVRERDASSRGNLKNLDTASIRLAVTIQYHAPRTLQDGNARHEGGRGFAFLHVFAADHQL